MLLWHLMSWQTPLHIHVLMSPTFGQLDGDLVASPHQTMRALSLMLSGWVPVVLEALSSFGHCLHCSSAWCTWRLMYLC